MKLEITDDNIISTISNTMLTAIGTITITTAIYVPEQIQGTPEAATALGTLLIIGGTAYSVLLSSE